MKKKQLVKSDKPKENVTKPLCGSFGGSSCTGNFGTGEESDILF
jgi:hypothetical protein